MADQSIRLRLYGSAKYGTIDVLVADFQRPLICMYIDSTKG